MTKSPAQIGREIDDALSRQESLATAGVGRRSAGRGQSRWDLRREIDARTITTTAVDPREISKIAGDASKEGREKEAIAILAEIPPIVLGRTTYRVAYAGRHSIELLGPRGGSSSLVQNEKRPDLWSHIAMAGLRSKTTWYKRLPDGTFVPI